MKLNNEGLQLETVDAVVWSVGVWWLVKFNFNLQVIRSVNFFAFDQTDHLRSDQV